MDGQISHNVKPWAEGLARFGYAAKAVVYLVVGMLAAELGSGISARPTNTFGAMDIIERFPFGHFLVAAVGIGLIGYVMWRIVEAVTDPYRDGHAIKGIALRLGYLASAAIYSTVAYTAARLTLGDPVDRTNRAQKDAHLLLGTHWGNWTLGILGLIMLGVGLFAIREAVVAGFTKHMSIPAHSRKAITSLGRLGYGARSVVFLLIGQHMVSAAWSSDSKNVRGVQGAQMALMQDFGGAWILLAVGIGLVCYAAFLIAEARYHKIVLPEVG